MGQFRRLMISQLRELRLSRDIVWTMYTIKIGTDSTCVEKYGWGRNIQIDSGLKGISMTIVWAEGLNKTYQRRITYTSVEPRQKTFRSRNYDAKRRTTRRLT